MNTLLKIKGFKCFEESEFLLNDVTLLTGSNGTGKSSLVQAILLARLAIEKSSQLKCNNGYQLQENSIEISVPLNNDYHLRLGTSTDIIRKTDIEISLEDETYNFDFTKTETSLKATIPPKNSITDIPWWRRRDFYYLHTERLGPRHILDINYTETVHCGWQGEYIAQVLVNIEKTINFSSAMVKDGGLQLVQLTNEWLDTICPGVSITVKQLVDLCAQIKIRSSASKSEQLSSNVGFGISYVLPIIVNGLIAQKDCIFIVENPEAHLHPKGQSNIGFFLGKLAAAGVKVIIETHSEHVVNGVRRAALSTENLKPNDVNIYFFNGFDSKKNIDVKLITIEDNGDLSDFPLDFFDQTRQDLLEILKLSQR
jgi:predicted ATPase